MADTLPYLSYYKKLLDLDRQGAITVIEGFLADGGDVEDLYVDVLTPALFQVGREWELGRISVAHEHYITEVTRSLIRRLGPRLWEDDPGGGPVAVACCVPAERHTIGLMMVCDVLAAQGLTVHMLGEGVPAEAIHDFVARSRTDLLLLSCALDLFLPDTAELINLVRRSRPDIGVVVGGIAFRVRGADLAREVGADYFAADLRQLRQRLPTWFGGRIPRNPS